MTLNWWEVDSIEKANLGDSDDADIAKNVATILRGVPDGSAALEIGSGPGRLMRKVAKHFGIVQGVDISQTMVDYANAGFHNLPQCRAFKGDGLTLPFDDATYDFVYSYTVFQHMHTREIVESYVREIYRVLRPGGMCRIQTVKGEPFKSHDGNHAWLFADPNDFLNMFLAAGFTATLKFETVEPHFWITAHK